MYLRSRQIFGHHTIVYSYISYQKTVTDLSTPTNTLDFIWRRYDVLLLSLWLGRDPISDLIIYEYVVITIYLIYMYILIWYGFHEQETFIQTHTISIISRSYNRIASDITIVYIAIYIMFYYYIEVTGNYYGFVVDCSFCVLKMSSIKP